MSQSHFIKIYLPVTFIATELLGEEHSQGLLGPLSHGDSHLVYSVRVVGIFSPPVNFMDPV